MNWNSDRFSRINRFLLSLLLSKNYNNSQHYQLKLKLMIGVK